jgi:hypothetical protein
MFDASEKWKELKAKFLRDFTPSEQLFFLKQAKECVSRKGYPVSEDLFNYCYFLTLRERLRLIDPQGGEGFMRFLLVESRKEAEDELKVYEKRLESKKLPVTDAGGYKLLEYLAGS